MTAKKAYESRAEQEAAEYGVYRATRPIFVEGKRAYNPGNAVPVSNVKKFKYDEQGLVEKVGQVSASGQVSQVAANGDDKK